MNGLGNTRRLESKSDWFSLQRLPLLVRTVTVTRGPWNLREVRSLSFRQSPTVSLFLSFFRNWLLGLALITMNDIPISQASITRSIANFWTNTETAGRAQFSAGFFLGRRELLRSYWERYLENHQKLLRIEGHEECPYFTDDQYSETELQYTTALGRVYDEEAKLAVQLHPNTTVISSGPGSAAV